MNKYQEALGRFKVVAQNDWTNNYQKCKDEEKTIHIGNYRMFEIDGEAIKTLQELVDKETSKKTKIWVESLEDVIIDLQRLKQLENKELEYIKEINKEIEIIKEIINYIKVGSDIDA